LLCTASARQAEAQASQAREPSHWSAEFVSQRAPVSNDGVDATWVAEGVQATWLRPEKAGWSIVVQRHERYGLVDGTAFTQGYFRTYNWTVLADVGGTPHADFMYRFTAGGEISRRVVRSGVGSIGYRYFQFPGTDVHQLQPGFTWYHAAGEIQGVAFVTRNNTFDRTTATGMVRAAQDITSRLRLGGGFSYGDRIFDIASLGAPSARSRMGFADLRVGITAHDFILVGASVAHEDPAFAYASFSLGYRRGF
jgi:YaiO family outer membrane protein